MKKYSELFLLMILFSAIETSVCYSQSVVAAAGGNSSGNGSSQSYTVGQIVYSEVTGTTATLLQGIQHYFGNPALGILKNYGTSPDIIIYPNPANDYIIIKSKDYTADKFTLKLYNPGGNLLLEKKFDSSETEISVKNYTPGSYLLIIYRNGVPVKTFKIIKN